MPLVVANLDRACETLYRRSKRIVYLERRTSSKHAPFQTPFQLVLYLFATATYTYIKSLQLTKRYYRAYNSAASCLQFLALWVGT